MLSSREFREDLYYRIKVLTIEMPPLRRRRSDIPIIINYFIKKYSKDFKREVKSIDAASLEVMSCYSWPGNVRELENAVLQILTCVSSDTITLGDLPHRIAQERRRPAIIFDPQKRRALEHRCTDGRLDFDEMVKEYSRDLIAHALKKHQGNKTRAAQALSISRGKVKYQIKQLGLE
jgi:transcriptional regulator with PAS, ATPase and Fis domain